MTLGAVRGIWYRAHDPRWAVDPESGAGAAVHGGRFNRKGVNALYLASSIEGAWAEAQQGLVFAARPKTVIAYQVDCTDVVDLRVTSEQAAWVVTESDLACPWRLDVAEGRVPATWKLADRLRRADVAGIQVASVAPGAPAGAHNLILFAWSRSKPHQVLAHDPHGDLPRNANSWT